MSALANRMNEDGEANIDRAVKIAAKLGAELTFSTEGITIRGRRFVSHVETVWEFFAWAVGYEAAFATMDLLYVQELAPIPRDAAGSIARQAQKGMAQ
jgi:hypothetical protein